MLLTLAQTSPDPLTNLTQFGVASLMGVLWWWERRYSRQREDQLTQAHEALVNQREHLDAVLSALEANTQAIATFTASHAALASLLRDVHDRQITKAA